MVLFLLLYHGNAFEDGVVEGSIVAVISLFVDLADAAVAYRAFPFTLIELLAYSILKGVYF
jgi:hypothetical protein